MSKRMSERGVEGRAYRWVLGVMTAVGLLVSGTVHGAGLLIADGGFGGVLEIKDHEVSVTVNNGIAVTRVTQVFVNTENRQVEALYTFPIPKGASVANFSMWINGKEMVGEVLEKERAREIYNSYKRVRRDPGLLEQNDYKSFEMRIFPIAAKAEQRVEVTYYQELDVDNDWVTYVYPLATVTRKDVQSQVKGTFTLDVEVLSSVPIVSTESPSHDADFVMAQHAEHAVQASLETRGGSLARDVVVAWNLSRPKTGFDLLTSRTEGEDGFFYLTLTAGDDLAALKESMDYVFVMDISGSMGNDRKLAMSRGSVKAFIDELAPDDRFEVMTFNVRPSTLFGSLQTVDEASRAKAAAFLESQQARGGTVLKSALDTAYRYGTPDRPLNVVILSDGMTEQAERQTLLSLIQQRPRHARVFCIGVGNEVNRPLLEQMAQDSGGLAAFLSRGDNFARTAKAFRRKLTHPVATDLALAVTGLEVYDVEPSRLPNLFHGSPVRIYGRYRGEGEATVALAGDIRGRDFKHDTTLGFPSVDSRNPEIERMWAWHRIDRLLKEADRTGNRAPVTDEVVRLGEAYSIVTEYTSFLVLENDAEYRRWKIDRRNALRIARDRKAQQAAREQLDTLRTDAARRLGPQPIDASAPEQIAATPRPGSTPAPRATPRAPRNPRQSRDFDFGTGPVGPLFAAGAAWMARRRRKRG